MLNAGITLSSCFLVDINHRLIFHFLCFLIQKFVPEHEKECNKQTIVMLHFQLLLNYQNNIDVSFNKRWLHIKKYC